MKEKLTNKQELFTKEYIIDLNATQAYFRAGYKPKNTKIAQAQASRLLSKPIIVKTIEVLKREREKKLGIDAEWVLREAITVYKTAMGELTQIKSYIKKGKAIKMDIYHTNLSHALKALIIIGKHVSVRAFDTTTATEENKVYRIIVPKELQPKAQDND
ncbi:MAG TPA: terminase small subunit [Sulfurimonas sp.]|nr:terminase small subunit [Sulfurimonas sp.]